MPENQLISEGEQLQPDYTFTPKEVHDWRQQGPYLVCKGCEIEHAQYVGMNKVLVGVREDGTPILNNR